MITSNAMSNQKSAADLWRCLYRIIHDEFPPIEETLVLPLLSSHIYNAENA
jgi:hypothetical protein